MLKLLCVSGDDTSSREALSALRKSGYHELCAATAIEAERLLSEGPFRAVIIGPDSFTVGKQPWQLSQGKAVFR